jgi:hypothetical protein
LYAFVEEERIGHRASFIFAHSSSKINIAAPWAACDQTEYWMPIGRDVSFLRGELSIRSVPNDQGRVASIASLFVASIGVLAIYGNLLMLLNNPRILAPMSKCMFASMVELTHTSMIILSEVDRYMFCGRGCTSQVRGPEVSAFEKHD